MQLCFSRIFVRIFYESCSQPVKKKQILLFYFSALQTIEIVFLLFEFEIATLIKGSSLPICHELCLWFREEQVLITSTRHISPLKCIVSPSWHYGMLWSKHISQQFVGNKKIVQTEYFILLNILANCHFVKPISSKRLKNLTLPAKKKIFTVRASVSFELTTEVV